MRVKKKSRPSPRPKPSGRRALPSASGRLTARVAGTNGALRTDVEVAAWLADEVLIAVASFDAEDRPLRAPADAVINGAPPALDAGWLTMERAAAARKLVLAMVPGAVAGASPQF